MLHQHELLPMHRAECTLTCKAIAKVVGWSDPKNQFGNYMFCPDLQGSQPCESLFRQARSFSSMYSNVVNFTMLEFVNRINKIQLQADIIKTYSEQITFPRFEEKRKNELDATKQPNQSISLTNNEIITQIENARGDLMKDIETLGITTNDLDFRSFRGN